MTLAVMRPTSEERHALTLSERVQVIPDVLPRLGVEPERRLVQEQDLRMMEDAARDLEAPLHAAGERLHQGVRAVRELDDGEELVDALTAQRPRHAVDATVQLEVLTS